MNVETKNKEFTGLAFSDIIEFVKDKKTISCTQLLRKFNKNYKWSMLIMDYLEEAQIVEEFQGTKDRIVIINIKYKI